MKYFQPMHYAFDSRSNIEKNILRRSSSSSEDCSRSMLVPISRIVNSTLLFYIQIFLPRGILSQRTMLLSDISAITNGHYIFDPDIPHRFICFFTFLFLLFTFCFRNAKHLVKRGFKCTSFAWNSHLSSMQINEKLKK